MVLIIHKHIKEVYFNMELIPIEIMDEKKSKSNSISSKLEQFSGDTLITSASKKKKKDKGEGPKKEKKKKDKKKKDDGPQFVRNGEIHAAGSSTDESTLKLIDIDKLLEGSLDADGNFIVSDGIVDEQRGKYGKRKKDSNPFKKEFAEEQTLLYDLLSDVNRLAKNLERTVKENEGSRTRGMNKNINETIANLNSTHGTRLQIIKELNSVKKTIADLNHKEEVRKQKSEGEAGGNIAAMSSAYLQSMLKMNRADYGAAIRGNIGIVPSIDQVYLGHNDGDDDEEGDEVVNLNGRQVYTGFEQGLMDDEIMDRLENEEGSIYSNQRSLLLQYENSGVKVHVRKYVDDGTWDFVALDRDKQIVHDYPLPDPDMVGKMQFNGNIATDARYVQYPIISAYSDDFILSED